MRRILLTASLLLGAFFVGPLVGKAEACPMCRAANESDEALPRAYMYSILFMLAVPATLFTGFSIGFYRLSKRQSVMPAELGATGGLWGVNEEPADADQGSVEEDTLQS